jgi:hypothetical protein
VTSQLHIDAARTPHFRTSLPLITPSSVKKYRACPRLYRYEMVDLVRPLHRPEPMQFGTLGHRGLEAWWLAAKAWPDDVSAWFDAALEAIRSGEQDPYKLAKSEALMMGYHYRWSEDMTWDGEPIEVVAVEAEYRAPLVNPETGCPSLTFQRGGKIDAIVRGRRTGRVLLVEHKHSSEDFGPGSEYRRRLVLDPQISHYHVGGRALGYAVEGCIYDVLARPGLEPKKATPPDKLRWTKATAKEPARPYTGQRLTDETPDEYSARIREDIAERLEHYFARFMVVRLEAEERASAANDWQTALMIRASERLNLWPQNPGSCGMYNRSCAFLGACSGYEDVNDPTRFRRAERPHEELTGPSGHGAATG